MSTLPELLTVYRETYERAEMANLERAKIMASDEYQALQKQLAAMTASVPDWAGTLAVQRKDIFTLMNAEGLTQADGFAVKMRTSRSVDVRAVLEAMGGDLDNLMLIASIKQKDLAKFVKDNPSYKHDLRSCIREERTKVVDVIPDPGARLT